MKTLLFITVICVFVAAPATADLIGTGDPVEGYSWTQRFEESGIGSFDLVAVKMVSPGDSFESLTHSGFTDVSWSTIYETPAGFPTVATAAGNPVTSLQWNIKFAGSKSNPLTFDYVAFNGNTLANGARAVWDGSWHITNYPGGGNAYWQPTRGEVVPVPGALLLGILGLGAVGVKVRKYA